MSTESQSDSDSAGAYLGAKVSEELKRRAEIRKTQRNCDTMTEYLITLLEDDIEGTAAESVDLR